MLEKAHRLFLPARILNGFLLRRTITETLSPILGLVFRPGTVTRIKTGAMRGQKWKLPGRLDAAAGSQDEDILQLHRMHLGIYERDVQALLQDLIKAGDVCYDIGAHIGFFTLLMARCAGERGVVEAFEPMAANLEILREQLRINNLQQARAHDKLVSSNSGAVKFLRHRNRLVAQMPETGPIFRELRKTLRKAADAMFPRAPEDWFDKQFQVASSGQIELVLESMEAAFRRQNGLSPQDRQMVEHCLRVLKKNRRRYSFSVTEVDSIRIDDWVERQIIRPPDFVKIDVEGAEGSVLEGMVHTLQRYRPIVYLELHGKEPARAAHQLLSSLGTYRFVDLSSRELALFEREEGVVCLPRAA